MEVPDILPFLQRPYGYIIGFLLMLLSALLFIISFATNKWVDFTFYVMYDFYDNNTGFSYDDPYWQPYDETFVCKMGLWKTCGLLAVSL